MDNPAQLTVHVAGLRGFPGVQGGVERHCEKLYPRLLEHGISPTVYARGGYVSNKPFVHEGVQVTPLSTIRTAGIEAVAHTGLSILHAQRTGARLLHLHAIGPALWTPFARRLGMQVVVTHHGFDYNRQKWSSNAKAILRRGEEMAIRHANGIVCISAEILESVKARNPVGLLAKIPNGVDRPFSTPSADLLSDWGLESGKYFLLTARFVQEKGIPDLINAWADSGLADRCRLAIAGGEDHPSPHGDLIRSTASEKGAVLTGVVSGDRLNALYGHARAFVLPSSHEGLPISLLEAMSWNLPVGASAIPANLEVGLDPRVYFPYGDRQALAATLRFLHDGPSRIDHSPLMTEYDWGRIAASTAAFYRSIVAKAPAPRPSLPIRLAQRFEYPFRKAT